MGKFSLDEQFVGPNQPAGLDVFVIDAQIVSSTDKRRDQRHDGAFTDVIRT